MSARLSMPSRGGDRDRVSSEDRKPASAPAAPSLEVALRVPAATIARILVAVGLVWVLLRLLPALAIFFVAVLLAVTTAPAVRRLERWGMSRAIAASILALVAVGAAGLFVTTVLPPLISQTANLSKHMGLYRQRVEAHLKPEYPVLATIMDQVLDLPSSPDVKESSKHPLAWGRVAARAIGAIVLTFAIAVYLLVDGKRTYAWLLAYVPRRHRRKMALTMPAVSDVVKAYVQGQFITSALAGAFAFAVLSLLEVPAVLPLSLLAAVCDVLPVLGIFVSTTPAVLFALTVSPLAAVEVLALYLLYHVFENYVVIPRIYGKRLRLSTLVVLVALVVGGALGGVVGAVLVLPIVAAYPIVERVWLHSYLSDDVVADHGLLEQAAGSGNDLAVDAILRGAKLDAGENNAVAAREVRRSQREPEDSR